MSTSKTRTSKYTIIPFTLNIHSTTKYIHYFSFGPSLSNVINTSAKVNVIFKIIENIERPKELIHRLDFFWSKSRSKIMYYEHPIIWKFKAKMLIEFGESPSITVNRAYRLLSRFKLENVWPPGIHLMNLSLISLLEKNTAIIHAGLIATKKKKNGILLFGASNTGKSYTVNSGVKEGYHFLSEDLVGSDGSEIFACPLLSTYSNILPNTDLKFKLSNLLLIIPILGLFLPRLDAKKPFYDFMKNYNYLHKAKTKYIFILERRKSSEKVKKLDKNTAFKKVLILNRMELTYFKSDLIYAYSYFNDSFNIEEIMKKEETIIRKLVNNSDCYLIRSQNPEDFYKEIHKLLHAE